MILTDVIIVGSGPVGLFAIFECGMKHLKCHVLDSREEVGGQLTALYPEKPIYDLPGFPSISGKELIQNLMKQVEPFQPFFHLGQPTVSLVHHEDGVHWIIKTANNMTFQAKAVILAAGGGAFSPNRPPLENLQSYEGKSVFYSVANPESFRHKKVVIAGGGDSAVDWAIHLCEKEAYVYLVHRRSRFRAEPDQISKLNQLVQQGKLELVTPFQLRRLEGTDGMLKNVVVYDLEGVEKVIEADYLLLFFGLASNLGPLEKWGFQVEKGAIIVKPGTYETNFPGVYAIGDGATYPGKHKLILVGWAEAACVARAIRQRLFPDENFHFEYSTTSGIPTLGKNF